MSSCTDHICQNYPFIIMKFNLIAAGGEPGVITACGRREAVEALQMLPETADIVIADTMGDFGNRQRGFSQQAAGFLQAQILDVLPVTDTVVLFEKP